MNPYIDIHYCFIAYWVPHHIPGRESVNHTSLAALLPAVLLSIVRWYKTPSRILPTHQTKIFKDPRIWWVKNRYGHSPKNMKGHNWNFLSVDDEDEMEICFGGDGERLKKRSEKRCCFLGECCWSCSCCWSGNILCICRIDWRRG